MCYKQGNGNDEFDKDFDIVAYFVKKGYKISQDNSGFTLRGKRRKLTFNIFAVYRCIGSCWYIVLQGDEFKVVEPYFNFGLLKGKSLESKQLTLDEICKLVDKKLKEPKEEHIINSKKLRKLYNAVRDYDNLYRWKKEDIMDLIKEADEGIL